MPSCFAEHPDRAGEPERGCFEGPRDERQTDREPAEEHPQRAPGLLGARDRGQEVRETHRRCSERERGAVDHPHERRQAREHRGERGVLGAEHVARERPDREDQHAGEDRRQQMLGVDQRRGREYQALPRRVAARPHRLAQDQRIDERRWRRRQADVAMREQMSLEQIRMFVVDDRGTADQRELDEARHRDGDRDAEHDDRTLGIGSLEPPIERIAVVAPREIDRGDHDRGEQKHERRTGQQRLGRRQPSRRALRQVVHPVAADLIVERPIGKPSGDARGGPEAAIEGESDRGEP